MHQILQHIYQLIVSFTLTLSCTLYNTNTDKCAFLFLFSTRRLKSTSCQTWLRAIGAIKSPAQMRNDMTIFPIQATQYISVPTLIEFDIIRHDIDKNKIKICSRYLSQANQISLTIALCRALQTTPTNQPSCGLPISTSCLKKDHLCTSRSENYLSFITRTNDPFPKHQQQQTP